MIEWKQKLRLAVFLTLPVIGLSAAEVSGQVLGTVDAARPLGVLLFDRGAGSNAISSPAPSYPGYTSPQFGPPLPENPAVHQTPAAKPDEPGANFFADEMDFDRDNNVIRARGNVEINYGGRSLIADQVTYDQANDIAKALGTVTLIEPTGEVFFADEMELTSDLRDGIARNIGLLLADKSRLAAVGAARSGGRVTEIRKGVYSPCNLCEEDPTAAPLWQIKAVRVIHDQERRTIEYRDAWLEVAGIPVLYTPFFIHPDPSVVRESGFLAPSFGGSSDLGFVTRIPYFYVIDEHSDATITPSFSEEEGLLVSGEYRKKFHNGEFETQLSLTHASRSEIDSGGDDEFRGHIDAEGVFGINRTWRAGFDVERTSDDTYLRRFGFDSPAVLNSRVYAEGFRGRNYFSASALSFQDLRPSSSSEDSPNVLPMMEFSHVGEPDRLGGNFALEASLLSLTRNSSGNDTHRLSVRPSWHRRFNDALGSVVSFSAGAYGDAYYVQDLERDGQSATYDGFAGRLFPYGSVDWRFPLVKNTEEQLTQTIEPIINVVVSPNGGNSDKIPNEDSQEFEFDDTNLFGVNRFGGVDKVEGGTRVNYGLKWGLFGPKTGNATFLLGQTFRLNPDSTFAEGSGLEDQLSDVVASVGLEPNPWVDVSYRTQIDIDDASPRRNELNFNVGVPSFEVSGSYLFFEDPADSEFSGREEVNVTVASDLTPHWRTSTSTRVDLEAQETRSFSWDISYEDECFVMTTRVARTFFEDRDLEPTDSITFNFILKTLGQFGSG